MTLGDFADELDAQLADVRERSPVGVKVEILNRPGEWKEVALVDGVLDLGDHVGAEQVRITLADPGNLTPGLKWARARIRQLPGRHRPSNFQYTASNLERWWEGLDVEERVQVHAGHAIKELHRVEGEPSVRDVLKGIMDGSAGDDDKRNGEDLERAIEVEASAGHR